MKTRRLKARLGGLATLLLLSGGQIYAADHVVSLKKRAFVPESISIKAGDAIEFKNEDPIDHNVSSQSAAKTFEIETLAAGQSQKVAFDKAGTVEIGCAMHDAMHLVIEVKP